MKKGFTLIELLVVIAIIGILASVVLTQVNSARDKTLDVAIKSDLDAVRATSVVEYDTNNRYTTAATYTFSNGDCGATAGQIAGTIFANSNIAAALSHIKKSNGGTALSCSMGTNGASFAIVAPLKTGGFACLDSTGALKTTAGVDGVTAYTGITTGATPALADTTADTTCN